MKKYYCVATSFYDDGRVTSNLIDAREADERPADEYHSGKRCDTYLEWFGTEIEAQEHINASRKA